MNAKLKIAESNRFKKQGVKPILIAGPCSAETEEQVLETATQLKRLNKVDFFRAGVWKPRTRPNSFEGVGKKAFPWLKRVQDEVNIPVIIEVAKAEHVELALENNIAALWIGARTTVNPFSVQEIANALQGVDLPVLIKNPINPDLALWIGALERLNLAGISELAAIHRGFSTSNKQFRNAPNWDIPIELKTTFPELPIICDPSHISGRRDKLAFIAQKALDLDFDGLMIESHCNPAQALSDAEQQVSPSGFEELVNRMTIRERQSDSADFSTLLEQYRSQIDEIDANLVQLLANRFSISQELGEYKKQNNVTVFQLERWMEILQTRIPYARTKGVDEVFMKLLMQHIHDESVRIQTNIFQKED